MSLFDIILNCVGLLLWLNWRSKGAASLPRAPGVALVGTLKRVERRPADRWPSPVLLGVLLFGRSFLYWQLGSAVQWTGALSLGPIVLHFRSDDWPRMLLFSFLSFGVFLAGFYFALLLIAAANRSVPHHDPWTTIVRVQLSPLDRLTSWFMLAVPFITAFVFWTAAGWLIGKSGLHVLPDSFGHLLQQSALLGIAAYLLWACVLVPVFLLHAVSTYVYFGNAPFWKFITLTARNLLRPISWLPLRLGKLDLAPWIAVVIVGLLWWFLPPVLAELYAKLPL